MLSASTCTTLWHVRTYVCLYVYICVCVWGFCFACTKYSFKILVASFCFLDNLFSVTLLFFPRQSCMHMYEQA